jgi:hypothetical protein
MSQEEGRKTVSMDLMYQVLVGIQKDLKELKDDTVDIKMSLNTLTEQYAGMLHHLGDIVGADARQNRDMDALRKRIERIEHRLEIIE